MWTGRRRFCNPSTDEEAMSRRRSQHNPSSVTLIVYGWSENAPGTLAWVFPSVAAAKAAVRALRNAVRWLIVDGSRDVENDADVEGLRARAFVLAESFA
jgi:hypothetical protein